MSDVDLLVTFERLFGPVDWANVPRPPTFEVERDNDDPDNPATYYAQRDRGPARGFHAPRRPDRRDGDWISRSDGQWAYEPYSSEAS